MAGQEILAEAVPVPPRPAPRLPLPSRLQPMRALLDQPAVRRSLPMLGSAGAIGMAALAWWAFQSAPQRTLFEGLADSDKAAVAGALESAGIPYSINRDTGAIQVGDDELQKARILLAGQGLPKAAPA